MGGKTHQSVEASLWPCPPGVWILRVDQTESSNSSITAQGLLSWHWFPRRFLLIGFCSGQLDFLYAPANVLSFEGQQFVLWPLFSESSQKSYWFFCLFGFLLVRMGWSLSSSLCTGLETRRNLGLLTWSWLFPLHCTCLVWSEFRRDDNTDGHTLYYHSLL